MCLNVAFPTWRRPAKNEVQKEIFFSRPKARVWIDHPIDVHKILRVHFPGRHASGRQTDIPEAFTFTQEVGPGRYEPATFRVPRDPEVVALAQKGPWAVVDLEGDPWGQPIPAEERDGKWVFGRWEKDGYGCFLSYGLPVGQRIELVGRFEAGPSGIMYQVGTMHVVIPPETKYVLWVRCSDTGAHSGFLIGRVDRDGGQPTFVPLLVSLFKAPHDFPARGWFFEPKPVQVPWPGDDLAAAAAVAEVIAKNGFDFEEPQEDEEEPRHIYDLYAAMLHGRKKGVFDVKHRWRPPWG